MYTDTLPPEVISEELAPIIAELGLEENCRQLVMQGWTVLEDVSSPEFNARFREKIVVPGAQHAAYRLLGL